MVNKIEVKCQKCGYSWRSKSKMFLVSCPRCGSKVKVNKQIHPGDNGTGDSREINF